MFWIWVPAIDYIYIYIYIIPLELRYFKVTQKGKDKKSQAGQALFNFDTLYCVLSSKKLSELTPRHVPLLILSILLFIFIMISKFVRVNLAAKMKWNARRHKCKHKFFINGAYIHLQWTWTITRLLTEGGMPFAAMHK
jgi:hypothetical protein